MKEQSFVWLVLALLVSVTTCYGLETASPNLTVTLEGSRLTWCLHWNTTDDQLIEYSIAVYKSLVADYEAAIKTTTGNTFDMKTLELKEGPYYIQVEAILSQGYSIFSEVTIYNVTSQGNTSQSSSLKIALLTISFVLAVALLVVSILFAATMWRLRQKQRGHQSQLNPRHSNESVVITTRRICCLCPCAKKEIRARSMTHTVREGPQLQTIEARDKKHGMIPLQFISRAKDGRSHSEPSILNNKRRAVSAARRRTDDLPYGYISPADLNIPQYREGKRHTVDEDDLPVLDPIQPRPAKAASNHYMNIDFVGGASQRVLCRDMSVDKPPSLSDSIYSIPCSLAASTDDIYDNAQHYLEVLPQ